MSATSEDKGVSMESHSGSPLQDFKTSESANASADAKTFQDVDLKPVEPEATSTLLGSGVNLLKAIIGGGKCLYSLYALIS